MKQPFAAVFWRKYSILNYNRKLEMRKTMSIFFFILGS